MIEITKFTSKLDVTTPFSKSVFHFTLSGGITAQDKMSSSIYSRRAHKEEQARIRKFLSSNQFISKHGMTSPKKGFGVVGFYVETSNNNQRTCQIRSEVC